MAVQQPQAQETLNMKLVHFIKQNSGDESVQVAFSVVDDQEERKSYGIEKLANDPLFNEADPPISDTIEVELKAIGMYQISLHSRLDSLVSEVYKWCPDPNETFGPEVYLWDC